MPTFISIQEQKCTNRRYFEKLSEETQLEMVLVNGGSFLMGSPKKEKERTSAEGPQHQVTVPTFFMGRYPVTQAQWRIVAGWEKGLETDPSRFKGDNRPVEQVSWHDAKEFCQRLSKITKRHYRLPTEAEWEYACRAGTKTPFACGETISTELANYNGKYTYKRGKTGEYREETTPVDHFGWTNAWGLSDMHGNVYEWCEDHWHKNYENASINGSTWMNDDNSQLRVRRGGSWDDDPGDCRSAFRGYDFPGFRGSSIGFRLICVPR